MSNDKVNHLGNLAEFCDDFLVQMKVDPISFVDVPRAQTVYHVAALWVVNSSSLLTIDHIFGKVHLVRVCVVVKADSQGSPWDENWFSLLIAIFNDFVRVNLAIVADPLLVLDRSKKKISLFREDESERLVSVDFFIPSHSTQACFSISESTLALPDSKLFF